MYIDNRSVCTIQIHRHILYYTPRNLYFVLYPTQRVAECIMFLTHLSVSQSVSPIFFIRVTRLKPLYRISWNLSLCISLLNFGQNYFVQTLKAHYYTLKAFRSQSVSFHYQNVSFRSQNVSFRPQSVLFRSQSVRSVQSVQIVSFKAFRPKRSEVFGSFHCHYQNGELRMKTNWKLSHLFRD